MVAGGVENVKIINGHHKKRRFADTMRKSMIYLACVCWCMGFLFSLIPGITYFILFSIPLYTGTIIVARGFTEQ